MSHENVSSSTTTLSYSTEELIQAARQHRTFLCRLHQLGVTTTVPSPHSLHRYLDCWIPLVKKHIDMTNLLLIPPPDIAWLWHCHRLNPVHYANDTTTAPPAHPPFTFQTKTDPDDNSGDLTTRQLWKEDYPNEPFYVQDTIQSATNKNNNHENPIHARLVASAKRQATFLYQISSPLYQDESFLQEAVTRYIQFLQLHNNSQQRLVPTYQIDFIWHTHMLLNTQRYHYDCAHIRGGVLLDHDDSLVDRTPGSILHRAWQETCRVWQQAYGHEYRVQGGLYRGEPPTKEYFDEYASWNVNRGDDHHERVSLQQTTVAMGASSSGTSSPPPQAPTRRSPRQSHRPSFVNARGVNSSSSKRNLATYEPREGYVFGIGNLGLGYYSLEPNPDTNPRLQDALIILNQRLKTRQEEYESEIRRLDGRFCLCGLFGYLPKQTRQRRDELERSINELGVMRAAVVSALKGESVSETPRGDVTLEDNGEEQQTRKEQIMPTPESIAILPIWMDPPYLEAAACGGSTFQPGSSGGCVEDGCGPGSFDDCCYF